MLSLEKGRLERPVEGNEFVAVSHCLPSTYADAFTHEKSIENDRLCNRQMLLGSSFFLLLIPSRKGSPLLPRFRPAYGQSFPLFT